MKESGKNIKFSDLPKHNIYQVPEGYFDRLPMRVMERTAVQGATRQEWLPSLLRPLYYAIAPFILLLVFVGVYIFSIPEQPQPTNYTLAKVADTEIVDYLNNYASLETSDFADLAMADTELTADFLNISAASAEKELDYYQLADLNY